MKKLFALILALVLVMALTACDDKSVSQDKNNSEPGIGNTENIPIMEGKTLADLSDKIIASAESISSYQLYTNSKKITITVIGNSISEQAFITLYDTVNADEIMVMQISSTKKTGNFTNLTSAKNYYVVATGLDGCEIVLSD